MPCTARSLPRTAMARAAREASSSAGSTISSEYAKPVFSPASARTPTPCSMLALPSLTMPSSSAQLSSRDSWKYRSAASTELDITCDSARVEARIIEPAGPQDELAGDGSGSDL